MEEFKEKHIVNYGCGCNHEIGLGIGGGFWKETGNNQDCPQHKVNPPTSANRN